MGKSPSSEFSDLFGAGAWGCVKGSPWLGCQVLGLALVPVLASAGVALAHKVVSFLEEDIWNLSGLKPLSSERYTAGQTPLHAWPAALLLQVLRTLAAAV